MFSTMLDPRNWKEWEINPSTRQSVSLLTKPYPVDKTLAVAGTAENLFTIAPGIATVNLVTNPSFETGDPPTGFTAVGATLAQSAAYYLYDSYSMEINPDNAAKGEGAYYSLGLLPKENPLAVSVYLRRGVAGAANSRVELYGVTSAARLAVGNTIALDGTWQRSSLSLEKFFIWQLQHNGVTAGAFVEDEVVTGGTSGAAAIINTIFGAPNNYLIVRSPNGQFKVGETITGAGGGTAVVKQSQHDVAVDQEVRIYIVSVTQHDVTFYADGLQAEVLPQVTPYCDGAQGISHYWDGAAHASTSRRWKRPDNIRSYRLHATRDCYVSYDRDASNLATNAEDRGERIRAGTDFGEDHPIFLNDKISFINILSGEQPRIYGLIWGT